MRNFDAKKCPRCNAGRLKHWQELNDDEKILAERLPSSQKFKKDERRRHLFCPNCWFETRDDETLA
jgi:hypothetical protein